MVPGMSNPATQLSPEQIDELLAQNAEMRRLLAAHQWSGLTPIKSHGVCPACCGSSRYGHRPGCPIVAALEAPTPAR